MDTPIKVSYRWSLDEVLRLNRLHMRYSAQLPKVSRSLRNSGALFLCIGVIILCAAGMTRQELRVLVFGLGYQGELTRKYRERRLGWMALV